MRLPRSWYCYDSTGLIALRNHFLPSDRKYATFATFRKRCFNGPADNANSFSETWRVQNMTGRSRKIEFRLVRGREIDFSRGRLDLLTNNLPSGRPKTRLGRHRKWYVKWVAWQCELIFCLLDGQKFIFVEFQKVMNKGSPNPPK
jgi:hypothetical protein